MVVVRADRWNPGEGIDAGEGRPSLATFVALRIKQCGSPFIDVAFDKIATKGSLLPGEGVEGPASVTRQYQGILGRLEGHCEIRVCLW